MSTTTPDYTVRTNYTDNLEEMRAAHKVLLEVPFTPSEPQRGYNMRSLHIDLTTLTVTEKKVTQQMKDTFVGGRGFGLWHLWNATTPTTKWNDPENEIVISPGPIAGITQYPGTGKSIVVAISPLTNIPIDCNVGGYYGPLLKFCGFDCSRDPGEGGPRGRRPDRRAARRDPDRGSAPRAGRQPHLLRDLHPHVRRRADRPEERLGRLGGEGLGPQPHRLPELLLLRREAEGGAAEAGGARRRRHGLPRQEAEGARRPRARRSRPT